MKNLSSDIALQLSNVSKKYEIHHEKPTLVEKFIKGSNEEFWALKNISLTIKKGERIGIIGPNGSGKTTLLKLITGITSPTSGTIFSNGKIVSLIDLESGFHPDISGYQNIYLNGLLIGLTRRQIDQNMQSIISFADLKQFIDIPMSTYSEGMKLRLGFSICIHTNPDILILDENIVVGDKNFQKKAFNEINKLIRHGKTVIIVSHWLEFIQTHCKRVIFLKDGTIISDKSMQGLKMYLQSKM